MQQSTAFKQIFKTGSQANFDLRGHAAQPSNTTITDTTQRSDKTTGSPGFPAIADRNIDLVGASKCGGGSGGGKDGKIVDGFNSCATLLQNFKRDSNGTLIITEGELFMFAECYLQQHQRQQASASSSATSAREQPSNISYYAFETDKEENVAAETPASTTSVETLVSSDGEYYVPRPLSSRKAATKESSKRGHVLPIKNVRSIPEFPRSTTTTTAAAKKSGQNAFNATNETEDDATSIQATPKQPTRKALKHRQPSATTYAIREKKKAKPSSSTTTAAVSSSSSASKQQAPRKKKLIKPSSTPATGTGTAAAGGGGAAGGGRAAGGGGGGGAAATEGRKGRAAAKETTTDKIYQKKLPSSSAATASKTKIGIELKVKVKQNETVTKTNDEEEEEEYEEEHILFEDVGHSYA